MVVVDSSVWIDFFRKSASAESKILAGLIDEEKDIAVCGLIRQEILQGIRDDFTFRRIRHLLDQLHYLNVLEPDDFDHAAQLYRESQSRGLTLRAPMDCLIAALAIRFQLPLLHRDRDFITIAKLSTLKLYRA